MGFIRGSLILPRMNAHRLVIIAAAFTIAVAAALATALITFSSHALPRAVRHDLSRATGTRSATSQSSSGDTLTSVMLSCLAALVPGGRSWLLPVGQWYC